MTDLTAVERSGKHRRATLLGVVAGTILVLSANAQAEEREEFHKTVPLASAGAVAVRNVNGSIKLATWERNEVKIDAVKSANSRAKLDEARIVVKNTPNYVEVKTDFPDEHANNPAKVEYTLVVPRGVRVDKIENVNGAVDVVGPVGDVRASTVNGEIHVDKSNGSLRLSSVNGAITGATTARDATSELNCVNCKLELFLPSDADVKVKAELMNGSIESDFGIPVQETRFMPAKSLNAELGSGKGSVKLNTVNGNIRIRRSSDGKQVSKVRSAVRGDSESFY